MTSSKHNIVLTQAKNAFLSWSKMSRRKKQSFFETWAKTIEKESMQFALLISEEVNKPITLAQAEVSRTITLMRSTVEALNTFIEIPVAQDLLPEGNGAIGRYSPYPLGVVFLITPFNFPLNLAIHKIGPALAAGNSVIWKPCPQAPLTSRLLMKTFEEAARLSKVDLDIVQIVELDPSDAEELAQDESIAAVSFTGSEKVGHRLKKILWDKKLCLELGGNAGVLIDADISLGEAAIQTARSANVSSGQSCCSAQRIFIVEKNYAAFKSLYLEAVAALPFGDPKDPGTLVGPLIDEASASRIEAWIKESVSHGSKILLGGTRDRNFLPPHVLENVPTADSLFCDEIFGPVTVLQSVPTFADGLRELNDTRFGLRASVYTNNLNHQIQAANTIRSGGVMINLPPTYRVDSGPFGGVKASGTYSEGPLWAMEFFSERRLITIAPSGK